jgi:hypothetical protein
MFTHQKQPGVFQIVALEPSPKWRGQGEVIKKRQFEMHPNNLMVGATLVVALFRANMFLAEKMCYS